VTGQDLQTHAPGGQVVHRVDQVAQVATQTIQLPQDQGVALAQRLEAGRQPGAVFPSPRSPILVDVRRCHPGSRQGIALQVGGLGAVRFRDPHVAQEHVFTCHIDVRISDNFALQAIDSSSGALGNATNRTAHELIEIVLAAPAEGARLERQLDRLWTAIEEDGVDFLSEVRDRWGELCRTPERASRAADDFLPGLRLS